MNGNASAFRERSATIEQPWRRLQSWLGQSGHRLSLDPPPKQFAGGLANLNYRVDIDGRPAVLRRPPAGPLALGANDMAREWSVTSGLWRSYPLCPKGLIYCDDVDVIGAPFLISEYRDGLILRDDVPAFTDTQELIERTLASPLAALHAIDPDDAGLGELGYPDGFLQRQVRGWQARADAAYDGQPPQALAAAFAVLDDWQPVERRVSLVHNDFKLDNVILVPETLEPQAVIDWDMTTRGDPLYDLAILLSYWIEPSDPAPVHALGQLPSLTPGFPSRRDMALAYASARGIELPDIRPYLLLARVRLGVAWQQLYVHYRNGTLTDARYESFSRLSDAIYEFAYDQRDSAIN